VLENSKCENLHLEYVTLPEVEKDVNIYGKLTLKYVSGDLRGLFDKLTCDQLEICEMKLSSSETKSLIKLLQSGVREVEIYSSAVDNSVLAEYDGQGRCERIWLSSANFETMPSDYFAIWADSVGWIWKIVEMRKCRNWLMLEKLDRSLFTLLPFH